MRISDWSSDVCASDLAQGRGGGFEDEGGGAEEVLAGVGPYELDAGGEVAAGRCRQGQGGVSGAVDRGVGGAGVGRGAVERGGEGVRRGARQPRRAGEGAGGFGRNSAEGGKGGGV